MALALSVVIQRPQDIFLANPVTLSVSPLTIPQAIARGLLDDEDSDNPFSPERAGKNIT